MSIQIVKFKPICYIRPIEERDDCRYPYAGKKGGKCAEKDDVIEKLRKLAKELIKEIGKKLLSGSFNLTTVSFPIKAMVPMSTLQLIAFSSKLFERSIDKEKDKFY